MSYRELRNFKEIMCTLGYPRLISIENFRKPHFELVADILIWLCNRYDKNMEILDEIRTEQNRVVFLKSVAEQLLVKARVKLNLKNLYQANGYAVKELLKIATLLYEAHSSATNEEDADSISFDIGPGHKFADLKATRAITADITKYGARLYELLENHAEAKESAARALGQNHDVNAMQRQLQRLVEAAAEEAEGWARKLKSLGDDEKAMQAKIDKKKTELDRHQKRLASLQSVRPAHMDEFEKLEADLSQQYSAYVGHWRNLSYLEAELDAIHADEAEAVAQSDRRLQAMQRRLREEELKVLRGQARVDERALDDAIDADATDTRVKRPAGASTRGRGGDGGGGLQGGMAPDEESESGDEEDDFGEEEEESAEGDSQVEYGAGYQPSHGAHGVGGEFELEEGESEEDGDDDDDDDDF
mmetsp:Transcript_8636/g.28439  ORF Transcript_8636/g.28439 Transcript_8636/m.28439 type:complete len:418 (-) Transcript_8636:367-1620(-)